MKRSDREKLRGALRKLAGVEARLRRSLVNDIAAIRTFAVSPVATDENEDEARAVDAFIQRFEQVFEVVLRRLFPATLRLVSTGDRSDGFLEMLNRLERLGFVVDPESWVRRKELRDRLVHEYPDDPVERSTDLTAALAAAAEVLAELTRFRARLSQMPDAGAIFDD